MLKYIVALLVLAALLAGIYTALPGDTDPKEAVTAERADTHRLSERPSAWTFEDAGEKDGIPQTRVAVDVHDRFVPVGIFEGNCGDMRGSAWELAPGASEGAICWFAGGGTEIAIFHEGDVHVIKTAVLEEGTAESGGFRGDFVTLLSI